MYSSEREKEILDLLSKNTYATVDYLAQKLHISPSSIRRDLKNLDMKGLIIRSYGGAEIKNSVNRQIPFYLRSHQNTKEKTLVAKMAVSLIKPGDVIFLDSSTSTYFMIEYISNIKDVTVITNSLSSMTACSEYNINSFFAGGHLNPETHSCCVGSFTEDLINSIHADLCFFSVQALSKDGTLYDCFFNELSPRKAMIRNSEKRAFLCDSSKINSFSAYKLCDVSELDYIISDSNLETYFDKEYKNIHFMYK